LIAADLAAKGAKVHKVDLTAVLQLPITHAELGLIGLEEARKTNATDLIIVNNPPYYTKALWAFDQQWLQQRCIVAHWVWELNVLPRTWVRAVSTCDEIWVPSHFVADTVRRQLPELAHRVHFHPYAVDRDPFPPAKPFQRNAARAAHGLSKTTFCVGYSFSSASNYTRKNPEAAIRAFQEAFPSHQVDEVALFLRCLDIAVYPKGQRHLRNLADADPRIHLFDGETSNISLADFYAAIDLYLAPFRSEGYGLNLVEASQAGLPVLATRYSLDEHISTRAGVTTVDYQLVPVRDPQGHYSSTGGLVWAEPNTCELTAKLRDYKLHFSCALMANRHDSTTP
jgi:glycosyltransferase involved in cell wall biosynthesis